MQLPEFMRRAAGPLEVKPEQKLISGYFNVDNGSGKIRGIYTQGNAAIAPIFAQWIAPLKDLGVTTMTNRNTGRHRSPELRRGGHSGIPVHPGRSGLRDSHPPLERGCLRAAAAGRPEADRDGGGDLFYDAAQRDQMLPRKPLPDPEKERQQREPLQGIFPGAAPPAAQQ